MLPILLFMCEFIYLYCQSLIFALCTISAGIVCSFFYRVFKRICYIIYYLCVNKFIYTVGLFYRLYVVLVQLICVTLYRVFKELVT
jgi:hypothetical protein